MTVDFHLGAAALAERVRAGDISAADLSEAYLARVAVLDPRLNAFTELTAERARAEARLVDAQLQVGKDPGPLAGVPFAVKNLMDIQGFSTLAGSRINRDHPPADADATLIQRLRAAGAVLFGALNMGEYAYDFTGENIHYGPSRNPHDPERMPGGSSGGSGTAVGAGMVPLALGSDTNGSIRVPASLCGIFGLKPTFGGLSRAGSFPFCASLDHLGPFGRATRDLALAFDAMQGPDPLDPVCSSALPRPVSGELERGTEGLRIAVLGEYFEQGAMPEALAAVARVADTLAVTRRVNLPEPARARAAAYVITASEAANLHRERLRTRPGDFDPAVRDRLLAAALMPGHWYLQAQRFRRWYHRAVLKVFEEVDVLIAPATPCTAPAIGQQTMLIGDTEVLVRPNLGLYTQPISFAGLPVVVAPIRDVSQLPMGVQLIAAPGQEAHALRVSTALEAAGVAAAWPVPGV